ncbi:MAG: hypothetical protein OSJ24_01840 [Muribaculaceae bacterium]|nr:hypothetical protein [Muribaculaceae bacterium]
MPSRNNTGITNWRRRAVKIRRLLRSSRGKDILIFLLFLGVSYVFWIIMALNDDMLQDTRVRLEITGVPDGYAFVTEPPEFLQVGVRDKGTVLANYSLAGSRTLKIAYSEMTSDESKDRVFLSEQQLGGRLRSLFDPTTQIVSVRPDSLSLIVTDHAPSTARVIADVDASAASQFVISGPITIQPDTVKVYTARHLASRPRIVRTARITRTELTDTLSLEVRLTAEQGTRIEPSHVRLTIPVEPLISKNREVSVQVIHAPATDAVVLFPSRVRVSYLLPMSLYNAENSIISVTADYSHRHNGKIPLAIGSLPDYYRGVELSTDSVEYLIEQKTLQPTQND